VVLKVIEFLAENRDKVELSFSPEPFPEEPRHVLVICQQGNGWLLTRHKERGLEFPGGKLEPGETLEEAARREVYEETGAILEDLKRIGTYRVTGDNEAFVKAVFSAQVKQVDNPLTYHETNGPVCVDGDLLNLRFGDDYSFIMQDRVVEECIKFIKQKE
jgi:8-oxo-dGTP diphosphatase